MENRFRSLLKKQTVIFDGGMGTTLFDHGVFINRCFDQLNVTDPKLILRIHKDFVAAGAMVIETNTFGANRYKLASFDLADKVREINAAGVKLALEAAGDTVLVAGAVGPLGVKLEPLLEADSEFSVKDAFYEQIDALVEAGVHLIILETFSDLEEIRYAIDALKEVRNTRNIDIPVICSFTVNQEGNTKYGAKAEDVAIQLERYGADVVGINCSVGPKPMLDALERIRRVTHIPLSVMPNAGLPTQVEGRTIYVCSPDYMANYARRFVQVGAQVVGGCCGTTPHHIQSISSSIRQMSGEARSLSVIIESIEEIEPAKPEIPLENRSRLGAKLAAGEFVATVELTPPQGWDLKRILVSSQTVMDAGFDAINIPDGPRASARMGPLAMAVVIERDVGIETVMHYACRDRNLVGMQADLLGAYALGLKNILVITGDPPIMGDYPNATAVFDVDAIGLTKMIRRLNTGLDLSGRSIGAPTGYVPMVGLNPTAVNQEKELKRLKLKVEAGALCAITQPVFDAEQLLRFLDKVDPAANVPVLAGIWPLQSLRNAEFLANEMPGVSVPEAVLAKMTKAHKDGVERAVGLEIAIELMEKVLPRVQGIQVSAPFGRIKSAVAVLEAARKIG
ncbi:MAG: bifunctional homocysteine S-methyltransferase/methylenetetrahydrofolate reductase [Deltaproteobacteria bacterium]|nr:bifunctional homocysteine S-methyltransferase/methylenetetrahydrofolate reductase [Deltaproteobacteria bacterium]MBN2674300.1 bifunctional homocysteine S-methyltransferase/methylenetetrahydrofolate reductase [Deltaproteobacteria bacterium]